MCLMKPKYYISPKVFTLFGLRKYCLKLYILLLETIRYDIFIETNLVNCETRFE